MRANQLALQLYTIRDACARDFLGTLGEVAVMGYRAVELAGLHGHDATAVRARLDELGVRAVSAHVGLDRFQGDFAGLVAELKTLGCEYAVVPWLPEAQREPEPMTALIGKFHQWAAALKAEGIGFGYHNHDFEFRGAPGQTIWDLLVVASDPGLLNLELDVFWAAYAGHDPVDVLARSSGRVPLIHLKDMAADGKTYVAAGTGTLDWGAILPAAEAAGARWYITEVDSSPDPMEAARSAYAQMAARAV